MDPLQAAHEFIKGMRRRALRLSGSCGGGGGGGQINNCPHKVATPKSRHALLALEIERSRSVHAPTWPLLWRWPFVGGKYAEGMGGTTWVLRD